MTESGRSLASSFSDASIWLYDLGRVTGCHLSEPQLPYLHNRCFGLESHSEIPMVLFGEKKKKDLWFNTSMQTCSSDSSFRLLSGR